MIIMIVAMDENHLIGQFRHLPWHNPNELAHFYECVKGHTLLVGRNTYDTLPKSLQEQTCYVLTHRNLAKEKKKNIQCCNDMPALLSAWKTKKEKLFICGGAQIYKQAFPYVDEVYLSIIKGIYIGDTHLENFDYTCFQQCETIQKEGFILKHYKQRKEEDVECVF